MHFSSALVAALGVAAAAAPSKRVNRKLQFFGVNESGAEFGEKNFTGVYGREYIWYDLSTYDVSGFLDFLDFEERWKELSVKKGGS
jgi:endoglucanase